MTIQQTNVEIARLSGKVSTLKGLPDVANVTTTVPAAVSSFYSSTLAGGSGPNGTYVISDFFGSAAGVPYNETFIAATDFINRNATILTTLNTLYGQMRSVAISAFGVPPTITIPSGPAAGVYATYDAALLSLVTASNTEIGNILTQLTANIVADINSTWYRSAQTIANEPTNRAKASIDYGNMQANFQLAVSAFIPGIGALGTDTQQGGSAQLFEGLANTANQYGQAFVGAMREGRNTVGLQQVKVGLDNAIPSLPATVPPQAVLSSGSYTVAEARAAVQN